MSEMHDLSEILFGLNLVFNLLMFITFILFLHGIVRKLVVSESEEEIRRLLRARIKFYIIIALLGFLGFISGVAGYFLQ